jgi:hypothetical protein
MTFNYQADGAQSRHRPEGYQDGIEWPVDQ